MLNSKKEELIAMVDFPFFLISLGLVLNVLIIAGILLLNLKSEVRTIILTGLNLLLIFVYVAATINMVEMYKANIGLLKMPVISVTILFWNAREAEKMLYYAKKVLRMECKST